jgi:hypothetical protein
VEAFSLGIPFKKEGEVVWRFSTWTFLEAGRAANRERENCGEDAITYTKDVDKEAFYKRAEARYTYSYMQFREERVKELLNSRK